MESDGLKGEGDKPVLRVNDDDPELDHDEDLYWWYRGELFTGEIAEHGPDGQLMSLAGYKDGWPEGWLRIWYLDGTLKSETFYADRKVVGVAREWHPNGTLAEEAVFENGERVETRNWDEQGRFIVAAPVTRGFPIPESPEVLDRTQRWLRNQVRRVGAIPAPLFHVAAVDLRYLDADTLAASAVIFDAETLAQVESASAQHSLKDARADVMNFEEVLAAIEALRGLEIPAGVIVCPGNGPNHTAEFNFATHLGVVTGKPTFGVSGSAYLGTYAEPGPERGAWTDLVDNGEVIGRAVRTREGEGPVFVTYGQRLGLDEAVELTLRLTARDARLPVVSIAAEAALPSDDAS
jgi:deoxyribonuclease V